MLLCTKLSVWVIGLCGWYNVSGMGICKWQCLCNTPFQNYWLVKTVHLNICLFTNRLIKTNEYSLINGFCFYKSNIHAAQKKMNTIRLTKLWYFILVETWSGAVIGAEVPSLIIGGGGLSFSLNIIIIHHQASGNLGMFGDDRELWSSISPPSHIILGDFNIDYVPTPWRKFIIHRCHFLMQFC